MENTNHPPSTTDDQGKLLLRALLAALLLFHGISKLIGGIGFVTSMLDKVGIPADALGDNAA